MVTKDKSKGKQEVITFVALTFALSALFDYPFFTNEPLANRGGFFLAGVMWCPGIAALVTVLLYRTGIRDFGFSIGKIIYYPIGLLLPLAYSIVPYSIVWISGLGSIDHSFSPNIAKILTSIFLIECIQSLGEEIGWRGFLVPKLARLCKLRDVYLVSGIVWAAWHYAAIFIGNYYTGQYPWYAVICFTVGVIGVGIVSAWIRIASGSIWPVVLLHAAHNVFTQRVLGPATRDTGYTEFFISEFGASYLFIGLSVGFIFWRLSRRMFGAYPVNASERI